MCIAIYKPPREVISEEILARCFEKNSDGCGMAYIDSEGYIQLYKTLNFENFMGAYRRATKSNPDSPFLIHFRIRTHGEVTALNCHPFIIDNDKVFVHNGTIIAAPDDPKKVKSDTMMFNETILQKLGKGWEENEAIKEMLEEYIKHSKLAVLRSDGEVFFFNKDKGEMVGNVWYSNDGYKEKKVTTYYRGSGYYNRDDYNNGITGKFHNGGMGYMYKPSAYQAAGYETNAIGGIDTWDDEDGYFCRISPCNRLNILRYNQSKKHYEVRPRNQRTKPWSESDRFGNLESGGNAVNSKEVTSLKHEVLTLDSMEFDSLRADFCLPVGARGTHETAGYDTKPYHIDFYHRCDLCTAREKTSDMKLVYYDTVTTNIVCQGCYEAACITSGGLQEEGIHTVIDLSKRVPRVMKKYKMWVMLQEAAKRKKILDKGV